ncbi:MAG TPA: PhzF family phenazine biosynthesis protein [Albidovulum sp.]|uniref:PhzF family phenazine biosynthesis protein n=1 Tax=Albidovulum sp. TaxID=1872424 RepID=UPI002C189C6D|nr:PhzF family phenazine biosynthesis protein [Albidovulum sp.]
MTAYEFDWVDAFTDRPFGGNGCAVFHDAAGLDGDTCMAIVRETSLVECTFLGPSAVADVKVRYFLASREIPFAGHPTIATVAALFGRGLAGEGRITLETGAGIVPVEIAAGAGGGATFTMTQVAPSFGAIAPRALVAAVGGVDPEDIVADPQLVSTGLPFVVTVLRDHDALGRLRLDPGALRELARHMGFSGIDMAEPYWITLRGATDAGRTFGRLLLAPPSVPEDPFTGSATGAAASYLWQHGLIESPRYIAEQGHWMGRPGQATVEVLGAPGAISGVRIGGLARVLMQGTIRP